MDMKPHRSVLGLILSSVIAGLLVAGVGVASAGHLTFLSSSSHKSTVRAESSCAPDQSTVKASSDEQGSQDEGDDQECDDPEGDGTTNPGDEGDGTLKPPPSADRVAACNEAAGIKDASGGTTGGTITTETKTGLDHAVEVVLANCMKNPQAPGLLNALRHLVANRDKHLAHETEKAARRAAREAARASRHGKTSLGGS
jgi:hypothetical protein